MWCETEHRYNAASFTHITGVLPGSFVVTLSHWYLWSRVCPDAMQYSGIAESADGSITVVGLWCTTWKGSSTDDGTQIYQCGTLGHYKWTVAVDSLGAIQTCKTQAQRVQSAQLFMTVKAVHMHEQCPNYNHMAALSTVIHIIPPLLFATINVPSLLPSSRHWSPIDVYIFVE